MLRLPLMMQTVLTAPLIILDGQVFNVSTLYDILNQLLMFYTGVEIN